MALPAAAHPRSAPRPRFQPDDLVTYENAAGRGEGFDDLSRELDRTANEPFLRLVESARDRSGERRLDVPDLVAGYVAHRNTAPIDLGHRVAFRLRQLPVAGRRRARRRSESTSVAPTAAVSRSMAASPRERRTCRASVMRATSPGDPDLANRMNQGRLRRTKPTLVFSGCAGSRSIPGTLRSSPGTDFGMMSEVAIRPALPNEQASPGVAAVDEHDLEALFPQSERARGADDARTDDDGTPAT